MINYTLVNFILLLIYCKQPAKRGSVLVFLPGMEEIHRLVRSLNSKNKIAVDLEIEHDPGYRETDYYKWDIVPLHSLITNDEQQRVFDQPRDYRRKIILSTNIAESSVTVPDIVYGKLP
jgi:HrpA-like RNA helicase